MFSPKNWLFSLFAGNDPWQNQGHSQMIAHSCGLHSLDNTSSTGFKVQRMSTFCSQMTNLSEWALFFSIHYPEQHLTVGNAGPYGSREAKIRLTWCRMLVSEELRECECLPVLIWLLSSQVEFINKVGVSGCKSNSVWSLFVISQRWHLERNKYSNQN